MLSFLCFLLFAWHVSMLFALFQWWATFSLLRAEKELRFLSRAAPTTLAKVHIIFIQMIIFSTRGLAGRTRIALGLHAACGPQVAHPYPIWCEYAILSQWAWFSNHINKKCHWFGQSYIQPFQDDRWVAGSAITAVLPYLMNMNTVYRVTRLYANEIYARGEHHAGIHHSK